MEFQAVPLCEAALCIREGCCCSHSPVTAGRVWQLQEQEPGPGISVTPQPKNSELSEPSHTTHLPDAP